MTPDDEMEFCGHICMAARRLGFGLTKQGNGPYVYGFLDRMARQVVGGESLETEKAALKSACEKLVDYLSIK